MARGALGSMVRVVPLVVTLLITPVGLAAQQLIAGPQPGATIVSTVATPRAATVPARHAAAVRQASSGRLVLGGLLGAAVGVLACNLISEAIEEVEDSSHCTAKGNLTFGIGGAALGVLVAALTD